MIPFDFEYLRPDNLCEAYEAFADISRTGKDAVYYGGGTELVSMARANSITFDAVIDLNYVPECTALILDNNNLIIGGAVTLSRIAESGYYPLLGETVSRIADHTIQCKITIAGNLASTIIYREAALPLLIAESRLKIMGENGLYEVPFEAVFDGRLHLQKGEFIAQIIIDKSLLSLPYNHVKKTKFEKIDYPLLTLAANKKNGFINAAVSGAANHPFVLPHDILNDCNISDADKINNVIKAVEDKIMSDLSGSKEFRKFVLNNVLKQMLNNLKEL